MADAEISRRKALKRIGAGAAIAWTAPVLVSTAYAQTAGSAPPGCTVTATLSGANENPPNASPATGTTNISVDPVSNTVTFTLTFSGLLAPSTAAHIHQAPVGVNGPVVVPLTIPLGVTSATATGTATPITPFQVKDICANPSGFYVNVHSSVFPGGEIRGQLS
jgi:hypothetical protein